MQRCEHKSPETKEQIQYETIPFCWYPERGEQYYEKRYEKISNQGCKEYCPTKIKCSERPEEKAKDNSKNMAFSFTLFKGGRITNALAREILI
jgi:hypothetical protein